MRLTPFDLVFRPSTEQVFPGIRAALAQGGHDPRDRDRFLMVREAVALVRDLRPEEGLGEGIDQLAALLHHSYLFWDAGEPMLEVPADRLRQLLTTGTAETEIEPPTAYYASLPEHRIWAEVIPGHPPEPLDGLFVHSTPDEGVRVLAVFGIHPERAGFSVVETAGPRRSLLARADGTPLFAPTLPGGKAAGLFSITGAEELLELGWRTRELGARSLERGALSSSSQLQAPGSPLPAPGS